jgi:hypothetical protein
MDGPLEQRIQRLERAFRLQLSLFALFLIAFGSAGAFWLLRTSRNSQIQARQLSIVDEKGRARIRLGSMGNERYGFTLSDSTGKPRALFELQTDGSPRLSFANPSGQSLAELTVFQDAPRLSFTNAEGVEFFSLSMELDGASRMSMVDQNGVSRVTLSASGDGSPGLVFVGRHGRPLAQLTVFADASKLVLQGRNGSVFTAPAE